MWKAMRSTESIKKIYFRDPKWSISSVSGYTLPTFSIAHESKHIFLLYKYMNT